MSHALRSLFKSPAFTAIALLTLALGIGANTTAFSVVNALLLHTPPYAEPERVVRLLQTSPSGQIGFLSPANFLDYRTHNTVFAHTTAYRSTDFNLAEPGQPADRLRGLLVTHDFFPLLRVPAALGRTFTAEEDRNGNHAVVVLSHATWLQRFGGDPAILGHSLRIDGESVTVIGVMPADFNDPLVFGEVAAWRPLALPDVATADRENATVIALARLKPEIALSAAQSALATVANQLALAHPATNRNHSVRLVTLGDSIQDDTGRTITLLVLGLAGFVLLIACANLANLQFARNAARGREHAIRLALGASRARLIRLVLAESVLLSIAGGALGLVLAAWTNDLVARTFTLGDNSHLAVRLDVRVLTFTLVVSLLTGIAFGLLPAWLAARANVSDALKQGSRGTTASRSQHRVRHALIVAQIALALMLLVGATFFLRGLDRITHRNPGWRTDHLLTAYLSLRGPNVATTAAREAFFLRLQERLAAIPGVERVGIGTSLPTYGLGNSSGFVVEGQPMPEPGRGHRAAVAAVLPGYFETLGIRFVAGRDFAATDSVDKPHVVVINETMARQLWPGQNPIGKRIGGSNPFMRNPREVIGVVTDVRPVGNLGNTEGQFQFYRALTQWNQNFASIALRTQLAPEAVAPLLRRALVELDPDQAIYRIDTVRHEAARSLRSIDAAGYALLGFAVIGLLLAALGLYGVISNAVVQRTNEIGVRLALGAQLRDILALILGQGLRLTAIGTALGLLGAFFITRLLRTISPEMGAPAPLLVASITALIVTLSLLAAYLPARRATRVSAMTALRTE
jgi:predicted permease